MSYKPTQQALRETKVCEKCLKYRVIGCSGVLYCSCECHALSPNEEKKCGNPDYCVVHHPEKWVGLIGASPVCFNASAEEKKCICKGSTADLVDEHFGDCPKFTPPEQEVRGWEVEFDKNCVDGKFAMDDLEDEDMSCYFDEEKIKQYIRKELIDARYEGINLFQKEMLPDLLAFHRSSELKEFYETIKGMKRQDYSKLCGVHDENTIEEDGIKRACECWKQEQSYNKAVDEILLVIQAKI